MRQGQRTLLGILFWLSAAPTFAGDQLTVTSVEPQAQGLSAPRGAGITIHFDRPVERTSVVPLESFWVFGRWTGTVTGTLTFSNGDRDVTLTPDSPLSGGDRVMVILSHDIEATDGTFLRDAGYSFQYWTAAAPAGLDFEEVSRMSTRTTPGQSSRAYGGIASDVDGDGWLDITIVNEDTADLRVFLNQADGSSTFDDFLQPTVPVGPQASPSEPSDFDRDGNLDICVANINSGTVSVVLGNGDGTFQAQQIISVNSSPRGIAVLDADGDGDTDIAVTSSSASTISLLLNDGNGSFTNDSNFGTGSAGEWALVAADMNEDGILDLVAGGRTSQRAYVYLGDGDGTFTAGSDQSLGGAVWMLASGDVNGDGHEDLVAANSSSNHGSVVLGDGDGGLGAPSTLSTDPFPLATDLGDLDGDGDLDWTISSFSGDWFLFRNDNGNFAFHQEFLAPQAASCSLMMDFDNDGDLDLALIDELEDEVVLMRNFPALFSDGFESGDTSVWTLTFP